MVTKGVVTPSFRPNTASDNDPKRSPNPRRWLSNVENYPRREMYLKKKTSIEISTRDRDRGRENARIVRSDATRYRSLPSFYQIGAINRNSKQPPVSDWQCLSRVRRKQRAGETWGRGAGRRAEEERKIKEMIRVRDRWVDPLESRARGGLNETPETSLRSLYFPPL